MKFKKIVDYCFVFFIALIILFGATKSILKPSIINYYENRTATQYMKFTINDFKNKIFQDNIEKTLSDQLPASTLMKKVYNFSKEYISKNFTQILFKNKCNNYIFLSNGILTYGCDDNLVYYIENPDKSKEVLDKKIDNINNLIDYNLADIYVYYIEKDSDINFETGEKLETSKYIQNKINTDKFGVFEINNFEEYKDNYYKTDHHWNYKGAYKGYLELANLLDITDTLEIKDEYCFNNNVAGSKANFSGSGKLYNEKFCVYTFDINEYTVYIDGKEEKDYGNPGCSKDLDINYHQYYGFDVAEVIFDFNTSEKENLLVIGDSFDNAILRNLASHYNKTFAIDLRHYENTFGEKFSYKKYVEENKIDKVLIIGNYGYYASLDFIVED